MQISDLADWVREPRRTVSGAAPHRAASPPRLVRGDRSWVPLPGQAVRHPLRGEAQRTKMIRHLGSSLTDVTYVFAEPTIGLHPHDIERMNDLLLQLRDKETPCSSWSTSPRPSRSPTTSSTSASARTANGLPICFEGTVKGLQGTETTTGRHLDDRATIRGSVRSVSGTLEIRGASFAQPPRRGRRRPARGALRDHGRRRLRQELADPRLGLRPRRRGGDRPGRDPRFATEQPGDVHRPARPDPQGVREGQRREAGAVQLQLRGRLPDLQRRGRHLHRARCHGHRGVHLRGVRRKRFQASVLEYTLGGRNIAEVLAMPVTEGRDVLQRRRRGARRTQDPRPARRRRARLPPRSSASRSPRCRAASGSGSS